MNKEQLLVYKVCELRKSWEYEYISKFIKGIEKECRYFDKLKPLFDEFGYSEVMNILYEIETLEIGVNDEAV